jgi:hypothetical protein
MSQLSTEQLTKQPLFVAFKCQVCGKDVLRRGLASHGMAHVRKGEAVAELKRFSGTYIFFVKGGGN